MSQDAIRRPNRPWIGIYCSGDRQELLELHHSPSHVISDIAERGREQCFLVVQGENGWQECRNIVRRLDLFVGMLIGHVMDAAIKKGMPINPQVKTEALETYRDVCAGWADSRQKLTPYAVMFSSPSEQANGHSQPPYLREQKVLNNLLSPVRGDRIRGIDNHLHTYEGKGNKKTWSLDKEETFLLEDMFLKCVGDLFSPSLRWWDTEGASPEKKTQKAILAA